MTGRTHDLAAACALGAVLMVVPVGHMSLSTLLLALLLNQVGGIAPDIDQPTAPFWRNLPIGGVVGRVIDKLLGGHRFISHSLIGAALFGFAAYWLLIFIHPLMPGVTVVYVWGAFMIGFLSHLVMDTFTKEGVPWLLPIPVKFGFPPLRSLRISTGKGVESYVIFPLLFVVLAWLIITHYAQLETYLQGSLSG